MNTRIQPDPLNENIIHFELDTQLQPLDECELQFLRLFPGVLMDIGRLSIAINSGHLLKQKIKEREHLKNQEEDLTTIDKEIYDLRSLSDVFWKTNGLSVTKLTTLWFIIVHIFRSVYVARSLQPIRSIKTLCRRFDGGIGECRSRGFLMANGQRLGACALNRYEHPEVRNKIETTLVQQILKSKNLRNQTSIDLVVPFGMSMSIIRIIDRLKQQTLATARYRDQITQLNLVIPLLDKDFFPWKCYTCNDAQGIHSLQQQGYSSVLHQHYIDQVTEYLLMARNIVTTGSPWDVTWQFVLQGQEKSIMKSTSIIAAIDPGLESFEIISARNYIAELLVLTDPQTPFLYCDVGMVECSLECLTGYREPFLALSKLSGE